MVCACLHCEVGLRTTAPFVFFSGAAPTSTEVHTVSTALGTREGGGPPATGSGSPGPDSPLSRSDVLADVTPYTPETGLQTPSTIEPHRAPPSPRASAVRTVAAAPKTRTPTDPFKPYVKPGVYTLPPSPSTLYFTDTRQRESVSENEWVFLRRRVTAPAARLDHCRR